MRKIAFLLLIAFIIACENDDDNPDVVAKPKINVLIIDADAHVIHERPALAKNLIIVGTSEFSGQKPGPVLKSRWISTYFNFSSTEGSYESGTSFSAPYVVKMAAEIKRRAPHYTNDEIAQLIFSTAYDIGEPGIDEVYGNGVLNPKGIFDKLTKRGY